jgi:hypothetical protein
MYQDSVHQLLSSFFVFSGNWRFLVHSKVSRINQIGIISEASFALSFQHWLYNNAYILPLRKEVVYGKAY